MDNQTKSSIRAPRIPLELQAVFLASQRGEIVNKPPPDGVASKTFSVCLRPCVKPSRVPLALQRVFLESQRGKLFLEPPRGGVAFKVFPHPSKDALVEKQKNTFKVLMFGISLLKEYDDDQPVEASFSDSDSACSHPVKLIPPEPALDRWGSPTLSSGHYHPRRPRRLSSSENSPPRLPRRSSRAALEYNISKTTEPLHV